MPTIAPCIQRDASGHPFLAGFECSACGEVLLEMRRCCPRCAVAGSLVPKTLQHTGKVFSFTIVHRSFPGIKTPFVSAVIAIDGGGYLKGNLVGIEPIASNITPYMPIAIAIEPVPAAGAPDGQALGYVFRPLHAA
jgi:uncharacterized OB-fold protein